MRKDFACLILTHGRADRVYTVKTLRDGGYTGDIYIVLDNEDDTKDEYIKRYGSEFVKVFDKQAQMDKTDTMERFGKRGVILFARNAAFEIAKEIGLKYFLELDDDYVSLQIRYLEDGKLRGKNPPSLDALFESMLQFLDDTGALTVAFSQGGDYIGGANGTYFYQGLSRKAMNTFFCRTDRPIGFFGTINEDVNAYTTLGSRGELFLSLTTAAITQKATQSNAGGMTGVYLDSGTYVKSFYSVMSMPSCVSVKVMGSSHARMHHQVKWEHCVPMILNQKYKKNIVESNDIYNNTTTVCKNE